MGDVRHISTYAALKNEIDRLKNLCAAHSLATEKQKEFAMRELAAIRRQLDKQAYKMRK